MNSKIIEKQYAIALRKKAYTYSEILREIPVAKSTLSLWLREVSLAKQQKQHITLKRVEAQKRGARRQREIRVQKTKRILAEASRELGHVSARDLWMIGIALYWAEGSKEKEYDGRVVGTRAEFCNTDQKMIQVYLRWLQQICKIDRESIDFSISLHVTSASKLGHVQQFWSDVTGFPLEQFQKVQWKRHNPKTKRKNIGNSYNGLLIIAVKKSIDITRRIRGWNNPTNTIYCRVD